MARIDPRVFAALQGLLSEGFTPDEIEAIAKKAIAKKAASGAPAPTTPPAAPPSAPAPTNPPAAPCAPPTTPAAAPQLSWWERVKRDYREEKARLDGH